jgi:hypothetical protein
MRERRNSAGKKSAYHVMVIFFCLHLVCVSSNERCDDYRRLFFLSIKPKHGMRLFVNLRKLYTNCTWIVPEDISSRLHNKFEKYPVKVWWLNTCQITIIWENWLLKSNFRKNWLLFVKGFGPVVILITLHLTWKIKMSEKIGISIHSSWKVHQHSYKAW